MVVKFISLYLLWRKKKRKWHIKTLWQGLTYIISCHDAWWIYLCNYSTNQKLQLHYIMIKYFSLETRDKWVNKKRAAFHSIHHAWQSNVWEMTDLKFTATAKMGRGSKTVRQNTEHQERMKMQLGRRKRVKQHVPLTTSWHSSRVVLWLCAGFTINTLWVCLNTSKQSEKQSERKTEGERNSVFLERFQHQLSVSLSLSFISLCVISLPHSVLILSLHPSPPQPLLLSDSLSASLLWSRVGSWEQKAGDWQDKSCFLILQLSSPLLSGDAVANRQTVKEEGSGGRQTEGWIQRWKDWWVNM